MTRNTKSVPLGPLSNRSRSNGHYAPPPQNFPEPTRVTNSLQPTMSPAEIARLAMLQQPARQGSMQAFSLPSKGGC